MLNGQIVTDSESDDPSMDETEEVECWIQCDHCLLWYHWNCAGVQDEPEMFLCAKCQ